MCRNISTNEFFDNLKKHSLPYNPRGNNAVSVSKPYGKFKYAFFSTGQGITYCSFKALFHEDVIVESANNDSYAFLTFNTGNKVTIQTNKNGCIDFEGDCCWHGRQKGECAASVIYQKNTAYCSHNITFTDLLFSDLTANNERYQRAKPVLQSDRLQISLNNRLTSEQNTLLSDLSNIDTLDNKLHQLYLESKLFDLIYTSIQKASLTTNSQHTPFSDEDINAIRKAKMILVNELQNPPSLKELAHRSAINEFKLKKGFKQLFGNTVYGYLQEHRLIEAKQLLETNDINIGEACRLVGYKNLTHFSKIFKAHFGSSPMEIKKQSRRYF